MGTIKDLQKPDIGPGRESRVSLKLGPQRFHRRLVHVLNQQHAVGLPMDRALSSTVWPSTSTV